jgi:hypothetical protein
LLNILALALCAILSSICSRQALSATPIDTDGPDYVESSEVVGKGRVQIEADFESQGRVGGRARTTSLTSLLRLGASETIELRVQSSRENTIGIKWHSQDRNPSTGEASVSWIFHLTLPALSTAKYASRIQPSFRSVITWDLANDWSLGVMPGLGTASLANETRYTYASLGVVLGKRLNERWRIFVESASPQIAHARNGGLESALDIGTAFLMSDDVQIGVRLSKGLNRNTPNNALLLEIAARF